MAEERGLSFYESERELLEAVEAAEGGDETALAVIPHYLEHSLDKRDRVATALRIYDQQSAFCDEEIARLKDRKERAQKAKKRLESHVLAIMQQLEIERLEGKTSTFCIRRNPPSVVIQDEEKIPAEYKFVKQTVVLDKAGIAKALKAGVEVEGADLMINATRLHVS